MDAPNYHTKFEKPTYRIFVILGDLENSNLYFWEIGHNDVVYTMYNSSEVFFKEYLRL